MGGHGPLRPPSPTASASCPTGRGSTSSRRRRGRPSTSARRSRCKKRVVHYLQPMADPRLEAMRAEAAELEFVVTDSEAEALLLENNWIKRKRPALQHPAPRRQDLSLPEADDARRLSAHRLHPPHPRRRRRVLRTLPAGRAGAEGDQAGAEAVQGAGLPHPDRRLAAAPLPLLRHAPLPGPVRGRADHRRGVRRRGRARPPVPRRPQRAARPRPQEGRCGAPPRPRSSSAPPSCATPSPRSRRSATGASCRR